MVRMKRSSLVAGLLTLGLHVLALGCLSLWAVGGGDVAHAVDASPEPSPSPAPASSVPAGRDTLTPPIVIPDQVPAAKESATDARTDGSPGVAARPAARVEVTPILMLSWQNGGKRRKTAGTLPTLSGPLSSDVTASFKVMVAPEGRVRSVRVVKGKNAAFEQTALARIKQWKFEPLRAARPSDQQCTVTLKAKAR